MPLPGKTPQRRPTMPSFNSSNMEQMPTFGPAPQMNRVNYPQPSGPQRRPMQRPSPMPSFNAPNMEQMPRFGPAPQMRRSPQELSYNQPFQQMPSWDNLPRVPYWEPPKYGGPMQPPRPYSNMEQMPSFGPQPELSYPNNMEQMPQFSPQQVSMLRMLMGWY